MILLLLLVLFLSRFALSSLLFIFSYFYFCGCCHQGYCFSHQTCGCCRYYHPRCCLGLRHLYCCYCCDIVLITLFAVVSNQVVSFVIVIMFAAVISVAIYGVGFVFLFWIFSICHGYCMTSLCIPFIYLLVIHPPFISVYYSHPIATEVLIVYLRTVNFIVKLYFKKFYNLCIYYLGYLILIVF